MHISAIYVHTCSKGTKCMVPKTGPSQPSNLTKPSPSMYMEKHGKAISPQWMVNIPLDGLENIVGLSTTELQTPRGHQRDNACSSARVHLRQEVRGDIEIHPQMNGLASGNIRKHQETMIFAPSRTVGFRQIYHDIRHTYPSNQCLGKNQPLWNGTPGQTVDNTAKKNPCTSTRVYRFCCGGV